MSHKAQQLYTKPVSATRNAAVSFSDELDSGELLTGTPTVAEVSTSDLTIDNAAVSTAELTINGEAVPIGEAVQFRVAGGVAGTSYDITISVGTDSTPAQTLFGKVQLDVDAD